MKLKSFNSFGKGVYVCIYIVIVQPFGFCRSFISKQIPYPVDFLAADVLFPANCICHVLAYLVPVTTSVKCLRLPLYYLLFWSAVVCSRMCHLSDLHDTSSTVNRLSWSSRIHEYQCSTLCPPNCILLSCEASPTCAITTILYTPIFRFTRAFLICWATCLLVCYQPANVIIIWTYTCALWPACLLYYA